MKHEIPSEFSERIQRLRTQASLSQSGLAELMGVTPAAVSHWETGKAKPSWKPVSYTHLTLPTIYPV